MLVPVIYLVWVVDVVTRLVLQDRCELTRCDLSMGFNLYLLYYHCLAACCLAQNSDLGLHIHVPPGPSFGSTLVTTYLYLFVNECTVLHNSVAAILTLFLLFSLYSNLCYANATILLFGS